MMPFRRESDEVTRSVLAQPPGRPARPGNWTSSACPPSSRRASMQRLIEIAEKVARTDSTVLIEGESGVGKELIARAIHHYSPRKDKLFVDVNCAAFPENLIESELFGYEKGAFSGADSDETGLFEMAAGGTLFLDEIGELDGRMQAKLSGCWTDSPITGWAATRKIQATARAWRRRTPIWRTPCNEVLSAPICTIVWTPFSYECRRCANVSTILRLCASSFSNPSGCWLRQDALELLPATPGRVMFASSGTS